MGRIRRSVGRLATLVLLAAVVAAAAGIIRSRRLLQGGEPGVLPRRRGPEWLRRFVTERYNPVMVQLGLIGGKRSAYGLLEHTGRRSGTVRRTPVLPRIVGSHALIPLPYGRGVDWVQNVLAAGHCRVQLHEHVIELDEPRVQHPSDVEEVPYWRKLSVSGMPLEYLRLRVFSRRPGTLDAVVPTEAVVVVPVEGGETAAGAAAAVGGSAGHGVAP